MRCRPQASPPANPAYHLHCPRFAGVGAIDVPKKESDGKPSHSKFFAHTQVYTQTAPKFSLTNAS